jgi:putative DNA primase/helicase
LETRELIAHTPNYFTPVQLPYPFDADAECPDFDVFLKDIMLGRQDYIELVQEFIGYLFRPDVREQKFLLCVGEGANGKGVLFELVQALIGAENCSQVPISRFGDRFALYSTIGKICNLTHESSHVLEDEAENVLKSYVGGDRMTIDRKNRDPVELQPTAKLLIATNSLPRFGDKTQAIWRRILLVPFDLSLEDKYQIRNKAEQLKRELPGVLNWALIGLDRLNTNRGFTVPQGQRDLMEEYRRDADPARAFLMDHYEGSLNGAYVSCADVYKTYRTFCEANGYREMGERSFGQHVRRIFPRVERQRIGPRDNRGYVYMGLVSVSYVS